MQIIIALVVPPGPVQVIVKLVLLPCEIFCEPLVALAPAKAPPEPLQLVAPGAFQVIVIVSPGLIIDGFPSLDEIVVAGGGGAFT